MDSRRLGRSELDVPVIGMGTWRTFDVRGAAAEDNAARVVDRALDAGACFFDSSPMYGEAERVLGRALEGRRDRALIATKVWTSSASEGRAQIDRALGFDILPLEDDDVAPVGGNSHHLDCVSECDVPLRALHAELARPRSEARCREHRGLHFVLRVSNEFRADRCGHATRCPQRQPRRDVNSGQGRIDGRRKLGGIARARRPRVDVGAIGEDVLHARRFTAVSRCG